MESVGVSLNAVQLDLEIGNGIAVDIGRNDRVGV
jgi:hypothetical protein